jgi:hypothetical protein
MSEEAGSKEQRYSLLDKSPEAIMARFKEREAWRGSVEGQKALRQREFERTLKEEPKKEVVSKEEGKILEGGAIERLADAILKLEERLVHGEKINKRMLKAQKEQLEMWVGGGYDALVSAEDAQMAIDPRLFETQPPAWYRNLSEKWQDIIRARIAILMGCYPKRVRGHLDLGAMAENPDVRIDRDALDIMWREMPGFRIALATIIRDLFEIREEFPLSLLPKAEKKEEDKVCLMVLKEGAREILEKFAEYKRKLITQLELYFEKNPHLLVAEGGPRLSPRVAARAAVSAAWNLLFVSNVVDSADQGDLRKIEEIRVISDPSPKDLEGNPTVGRKVRNPIVYAEQARAMMLPFDKAWSKSIRGEEEKIGTEETWLGSLGDYLAERNRHDKVFRGELFRRERRIIPQRLFASLLDLVTFRGEKKGGVEVTVGMKLCDAEKKNLGIGELCDFSNPEEIDFKKLPFSELWGGYADIWDSARKIYEMLGGKNPLKLENVGAWRQTLATALAKLRSTPLAPYYKDPHLLVGCIAGSVGLTHFTSRYLLALPENQYDILVNLALNDDRLFKDVPGGRKAILELLNAYDHYSLGGVLGSILHSRRSQIRLEATNNARAFNK